jgi:hypothetical protein
VPLILSSRLDAVSRTELIGQLGADRTEGHTPALCRLPRLRRPQSRSWLKGTRRSEPLVFHPAL